MNDTNPPLSAPHAVAPVSLRAHARLWISIVVVLVIIVIAAFIPVGGDHLWHRLYVVHELKGVYVAKGNAEPVAPYSFGITGLKPHQVPGATGTLGDFAEAHGTRVAITRASEDAPQQVQELAPAAHALSNESGAKSIVAVSPDGSMVAYSVATSTNTFSQNLSSWSVRLVTLSTGTTFDLGPGFGPEFFIRDGKTWLLYTIAKGLTVMDVAAQKSFSTPFDFSNDIGFMAQISPNGQYIGLRDAATRRFSLYTVYRVGADVPIGIKPMQGDVSGFADIQLTSKAVYGTKFVKETGLVQVNEIPFSNPGKSLPVYFFPADANYRFIL